MPEDMFGNSCARCVAVAAALCLLLVLLPASPARAAVDYTGSVTPTDVTGNPTTVFTRGQPVYSNVELAYQGTPYDGAIKVELRRTTDGFAVSAFNTRTNNPAVGWNNGSFSGFSLSTAAFFSGNLMTYDVVAYYTGGGSNEMIARAPVIVKAEGLSMDPASDPHYPGESVKFELVTSHTTDMFYVQVVNDTGNTLQNWTAQVALTGTWGVDWIVPDDFPDGTFTVNVRDSITHAIWNHLHFSVQKYMLYAGQDRGVYLPGEVARIYYLVLDTSTFAPSSGVSIEYSSHWVNGSGIDSRANGSLPGTEGTHEFLIPADSALYADVQITYWANETSSGRSFETTIWLTLGQIDAYLEVSGSTFNPGDAVEVVVIVSADNQILPGASVDISIELDGLVIPAYGATDLITGDDSRAYHSFVLDAGAQTGTYVVNATAEKAGHVAHVMTVFQVVSTVNVIVEFDKMFYYSGDTALVQIKVVRNGVEIPGHEVTYLIVANMTTVVGTGQNTTGTVSYLIPLSFYGVLIVEAIANIDGQMISGMQMCEVRLADVTLSAEMNEYSPGDSIVFDYQIFTNLAGGDIAWEIVDDNDVRVASGTPPFSKTGSFSYDVPTVWSADSYLATVSFETPSGGYMDESVIVTKALVPPITLLPFLRVDDPVEGAVTSVPVVRANGSTEQGVLLNVNGFTVLPDDSGKFALNLPLLEGSNLITIIADNGLGITTITRNVTFTNPVPGLVSQMSQIASDLAQSQSSMTAIWGQLNSTDDDISEAMARLNATESTIGAIWNTVNLTDASIAALQTEVNALRAELILTHSGLNTTDAGLASLESSIDAVQAQLDSARASLNATMSDLTAAQAQLDSLQTDLEDVQDDIETKAPKASVTMWFAVAIILSAVFAAAVFVLLKRKP